MNTKHHIRTHYSKQKMDESGRRMYQPCAFSERQFMNIILEPTLQSGGSWNQEEEILQPHPSGWGPLHHNTYPGL